MPLLRRAQGQGIDRRFSMNSNLYLAHFGVKGMKWGVRRDRRRAAQDSLARAHFDRIGNEISNRNYKLDRVSTGLGIHKSRARVSNEYGPSGSLYSYSKSSGFTRQKPRDIFTSSRREDALRESAQRGRAAVNALGMEYMQKAISQNNRDQHYLNQQRSAYAKYQERRDRTFKDRTSALGSMTFDDAKKRGKAAVLRALESYGSSGYYL